jgi:hypothetical protein
MKNLNQSTICAKNSERGLDIYLRIDSNEHYITTHRPNGLLWTKIKSGISLGELKRVKPKYTRMEQKYYHYSRYLLKVVDDYIQYDLRVKGGI